MLFFKKKSKAEITSPSNKEIIDRKFSYIISCIESEMNYYTRYTCVINNKWLKNMNVELPRFSLADLTYLYNKINERYADITKYKSITLNKKESSIKVYIYGYTNY